MTRFVNGERAVIRHSNADRWPGHEDVVRAHYGRVRRLCELLLGDRQEAEEVVQETFMKAYEATLASGTPNDWAAWLTQVAINACRDRRRAGWWIRFRRWTDPIEDVPLAAVDPSPVDAATGQEVQGRIWAAFRRLPQRQREVFVLRHIEERSTAEVAVVLGLDQGSVKRHLFRAIRKMRDALGDQR